MIEEKSCLQCNIIKSFNEFYQYKKTGKLYSICKFCLIEKSKKYNKSIAGKISSKRANQKYQQTDKGKLAIKRTNKKQQYLPNIRYSQAKSIAKRNNKKFTLTYEKYIELFHLPCYYCNDLLDQDEKKLGIRLDRINNSLGYDLDNVLPCCGFCNKTRGNRLTVGEMKLVAELLLISRKVTKKCVV